MKLPIKRNSLPWPAVGKVISNFGREAVPSLKTWIVHEGIRIRTSGDGGVRSVYSGEVIYSGHFRSYGNVVIIDHRKGFFTVYGLLKNIAVKKGRRVRAGTVIGEAGTDTRSVSDSVSDSGEGTVYFEIRSGS